MDQNYKKEQTPHLLNWQLAYAARELRHNKTVTLSCLRSDTDFVIEQINLFTKSNKIKAKTVNKPNSKEVFLEIAESI